MLFCFSSSLALAPILFSQLTGELASLKLEHEALWTKHQLAVSDYEKRLGESKNAMREAEHICQERAKVIDHLESTNTAMVSSECCTSMPYLGDS